MHAGVKQPRREPANVVDALGMKVATGHYFGVALDNWLGTHGDMLRGLGIVCGFATFIVAKPTSLTLSPLSFPIDPND